MDFLKDIVKEIGDDFTQLAADIDGREEFVDTGSYIFNAMVKFVVYRWHLNFQIFLNFFY